MKQAIPPVALGELSAHMDTYGEHGWELVSVVPYGVDECLFFYKKPA